VLSSNNDAWKFKGWQHKLTAQARASCE